jgi:cytochrome oxidase Cu insertion factor (SCO1/SenC/PrrC family)
MDHAKPLRLHYSSKSGRTRASIWIALIVFAAASLALTGWNRTSHESGVYPVTYHASSLPNVALIDQYGQSVAVASLRGKPVLFDFIYTSCPGPCQLLTQHMKLIADQLGPDLGPKVLFVSVTVDPDRDRPTRLPWDAGRRTWWSPSQAVLVRSSVAGGTRRTSPGLIWR